MYHGLRLFFSVSFKSEKQEKVYDFRYFDNRGWKGWPHNTNSLNRIDVNPGINQSHSEPKHAKFYIRRTRQCRKILWVIVVYHCLIEATTTIKINRSYELGGKANA